MNRNGDEENKGYKADIPQELLDEAVRSVEQESREQPKGLPEETAAVEVQVEPADDEHEAGGGEEKRRGPSREELIEALEKSRAEAKAARERMLRALADVDNQRKRLARERQEIVKFGNESLLRDLLVPLDNLERTLEHLPSDNSSPAMVALRDGLQMVVKQFADVLAKYG
ncbi:MAG: nucleotide exchange factor GrpE, partial [Deltaproteobacteria bacterium]